MKKTFNKNTDMHRTDNSSSTIYSDLTNKTINYILEHLPDELSVQKISQTLYVNPSVLSRKFKKETGETLSGYIINNRIRLAQHYLKNGYKNITEVALLTGFSDGNYFSRVYKKITGSTPSAYIQELQNIPGSVQ